MNRGILELEQNALQFALKNFNSEVLNSMNPLVVKKTLTKEERNSLSDTEKILRGKIQARKSKFRYNQKNPEKAKEKMEAFKAKVSKMKVVEKKG